jgi:hypothetical protein
MTSTSLIQVQPLNITKDWCVINDEAKRQKELVLSSSALVGKVTNQKENDTATSAMKQLKSLSGALERERKDLTEPLLEAQRALKRAVDTERDDLDRECGRIECLVKDFALAERRRILEEQEMQQRELERIERERQAELKRITDEQARIEREALEAKLKAEAEAKAATNKAQRDAAAKAMLEAETKQAEASKNAAAATQQVQEAADLATRIESKPVEITRSIGQNTRKIWVIKQINDFQLMRSRPDLVRKIEWDIAAIKEVLNSGGTLPGVVAEEDLRVGVRGKAPTLIEV